MRHSNLLPVPVDLKLVQLEHFESFAWVVGSLQTCLHQSICSRLKKIQMKKQELLDRTNNAKVELTAAAHQSLIAVLDHSKSNHNLFVGVAL